MVPNRVGTEQESSPNLLHQEPNQVDAPRPPPPAHVRYSDVLCGQAKSSIQQTDEPELASKPIMLLGNLTSILLTVVALLQALSWTIAGLLILTTLSITTLLPLGNAPGGASRSQTKKPSNHLGLPESKYPLERTQDKQITKPHQVPERPEQKPLSKHEPSKSPSQLSQTFRKR